MSYATCDITRTSPTNSFSHPPSPGPASTADSHPLHPSLVSSLHVQDNINIHLVSINMTSTFPGEAQTSQRAIHPGEIAGIYSLGAIGPTPRSLPAISTMAVMMKSIFVALSIPGKCGGGAARGTHTEETEESAKLRGLDGRLSAEGYA
jgi:hypothetical protein